MKYNKWPSKLIFKIFRAIIKKGVGSAGQPVALLKFQKYELYLPQLYYSSFFSKLQNK